VVAEGLSGAPAGALVLRGTRSVAWRPVQEQMVPQAH
jgi:hypothetical protein